MKEWVILFAATDMIASSVNGAEIETAIKQGQVRDEEPLYWYL